MEGRALRQQPGFACEECRRRKARCDRGRPKCGFCAETGTTCVIVDRRQQRGPKKGQLNAMRSQIAALQWQLEQHFGSTSGDTAAVPERRVRERESESSRAQIPEEDSVSQTNGLDAETHLALTCTTSTASSAAATTAISASTLTSTCTSSDSAAGADLVGWADCMDWQDPEDALMPSDGSHGTEITLLDHFDRVDAGPSLVATRCNLTNLMQADLDQLYFDRVHPVLPIVHHGRYLAWASQESLTPARACLQSAMRTMAAAMSGQWAGLADQLCAETRHLLETHGQTPITSKDEIPLEHIQAWLLLAYAELLRIGEHQAMLTVGRAFRLVQMARLYNVDALDNSQVSLVSTDHALLDESFVDAEERRRTFWLAFSFDRFLCLRSGYPLTLREEMATVDLADRFQVHTRLPAPEENYRNNRSIRMGFLPEALAEPAPSTLSPFAECIVLAALQGRCMTHRDASVEDNGLKVYDFWTQQEWLASAVERRVQTLVPYSPVDGDPMLLFAHMLAHSAIVFLSDTVQSASWHTSTLEQQLVTAAYARRATVAALEIVRLAKTVPALSCFKAHPFLPDPLACAANFLSAPFTPVVGRNEGVEQLLRVLQDAQVINGLAREHFQSLKSSRSKSKDSSSQA
ncbi:fungal-specific transcription factor domain-containing protein [Chaetomium strumarium]|uniref:Fungal-specific transcription factor domain-containing protein n=1 Tax=Chaetomium strumarium TaxID=1170767 RepID=A0AAJ0GRM0_9PEZI|nr:fungal-specific transcription factor domain-containing protein [Chaetomium strumarium]